MTGGQSWVMCSLLQEDPYVGGLDLVHGYDVHD
jgi:hypothetical protein